MIKLFNIELTNKCNASCSFCPHDQMTRPVGYMSERVFALAIAEILRNPPGPGRTTNLHNLGESTFHPKLCEFIEFAVKAGITCALSTNGSLLTQELVTRMENAGLAVLRISYDALCAPYDFEARRMIIKPHAILPDSAAPPGVMRKGMISWGGLIEHPDVVPLPRVECSFLTDGWRVVLWDGTIVQCCHDINGDWPMGVVGDGKSRMPGIPLCKECHGYVMKTALVAGNYGTGESDVEIR